MKRVHLICLSVAFLLAANSALASKGERDFIELHYGELDTESVPADLYGLSFSYQVLSHGYLIGGYRKQKTESFEENGVRFSDFDASVTAVGVGGSYSIGVEFYGEIQREKYQQEWSWSWVEPLPDDCFGPDGPCPQGGTDEIDGYRNRLELGARYAVEAAEVELFGVQRRHTSDEKQDAIGLALSYRFTERLSVGARYVDWDDDTTTSSIYLRLWF